MKVEQCSFLKFALKCGTKCHKKETLRIFIRMLLEFSLQTIFVAYGEDNKIVAFAVARRLPSKYIFDKNDLGDSYIIGPIWVMPEYRQCGVGYMIINRLKNCILRRCHHIYAYIGVANIPSQKLFSKCGFDNIGYMVKDNNKYYLTQDKSEFFVFKNAVMGGDN